MCTVGVLFINGFYKVYYSMFDLIEQILVSFLILIVMFIFFLPLFMRTDEEHSRPLFTILVLVVGVVGGLTLVITVVYFYRFCLKKRPPLTTTCRPEQKRDAVRSEASTACRPLPLPIKNGLYQTQPTIARLVQLDGTRIPQAVIQKSMDRPILAQRDSDRSQNLPLLTYTSENLHHGAGAEYDNEAHARGSLRSSAELLPPEDLDLRRPSVDAPKRRQLPSIEHLERGLSLGERQNLLMSGERRRANTMVRTNAVLSPNAPVKQYQKEMMAKKNSSPLPQERRSIYTKDHLYSKSWNPDLHYDDEESYQQAPSTAATRYGATNQTLPYSLFPSTNPAQPRRTSNSYHLSVRQPFERQAKSFDEWANERISGWTERRSLSEREDGVREGIQRQTNQQHEEALIAGTAIAHQCQSLWEARSHLEHLRRLGIEDPSSASTSFESNTEATLVSPRNTPRNGRESVDERRNKYRSLFLQRKTLPGQRVDSIESTFSNDSSMGFVDEMRRATLAQITSIDSGDRSNENASRRPLRNQRDYSVDATSDSMFREFSRVDPKYEMFLDSMRQNSDRDRLPVSSHFLPKWETFDIAGSQQKNRRLSTSRQMSQNENYRFA